MRLSWIIWIGPNPTASVLIAEEKIHRLTHMGDVKMKAEIEVMWP